MKFIFCLLINTKGFFKVILSFLLCVAIHAFITQHNKFAISLQHLKREVIDAVDILHSDNHESLVQIDTVILMEMVKCSRSSQNSKFAVSLQYLKKEVRDEVDFLHEDKHPNFLQGDTTTIDRHDLAFSKYSK